jgi:two-component system KDP operon response regulator KdpE
LERGGFELSYAGSLGDAVRRVVSDHPDAVLALAPPAEAAAICEVFPALASQPVIIAGSELPAGVAAECLDRGADAVFSLPMPAKELLARMESVCRRAASRNLNPTTARIKMGDLSLDGWTRSVRLRGKQIDLSPTEFHVLALLAERPGRVVTNRELLTRVWSEEYADDVHYVRLYIGYLRAKLEKDPRHPELILTQWGVGYRLVVERAGIAAAKASPPPALDDLRLERVAG